ncbi:MAG: hypothetical protein O7C98_10375 [Planctomycetota bacterium]|nr:hypothetical protein [Planctomycetota bacterium]
MRSLGCVVLLVLSAAPAAAGMAEQIQRALRKEDHQQRLAGLELAKSGLGQADKRERNRAASKLGRALKSEVHPDVKRGLMDFLLALRTERALDRLILAALDPDPEMQRYLRELIRDRADPAFFRAVRRALKEDASWRFRVAMVQLLLSGARERGRQPLVAALGDEHPAVAAAAAEALERMTGQAHGLDAAAWRKYFGSLEAPEPVAPHESRTTDQGVRKVTLYEGPIRGLVPTLYTIPIRSKLVLFVVDMSSSLRSGSRTVHFDELKRALFLLPSDVRFNVLVFDQRLFFFGRAKGLVAATPAAKAEVQRWLDGLPAGQHTDLNRSMASGLAMLREALEQNPKSEAELFVLTDGRETVKTMPFAAVRSQFDRLPKKRCLIHVVQLGKHGTSLLQQLASSTGGRYHETRAK